MTDNFHRNVGQRGRFSIENDPLNRTHRTPEWRTKYPTVRASQNSYVTVDTARNAPKRKMGFLQAPQGEWGGNESQFWGAGRVVWFVFTPGANRGFPPTLPPARMSPSNCLSKLAHSPPPRQPGLGIEVMEEVLGDAGGVKSYFEMFWCTVCCLVYSGSAIFACTSEGPKDARSLPRRPPGRA